MAASTYGHHAAFLPSSYIDSSLAIQMITDINTQQLSYSDDNVTYEMPFITSIKMTKLTCRKNICAISFLLIIIPHPFLNELWQFYQGEYLNVMENHE